MLTAQQQYVYVCGLRAEKASQCTFVGHIREF